MRNRPTLALLCLAGTVLFAESALAVQYLPHRATYDLKSTDGGGFGQAADAIGLLTYELADTCDGWTISQRAGIKLVGAEGEQHAFDWSQSTWEAKNGEGYRYSIRESRDGELLNRKRGEVRFPEPGGPGVLTTELPARSELTIEGALLPMAHSTAILEEARTGSPVFLAKVFDPSLADHPVEISAAMTGEAKDWEETGKDFPALQGQISRQIDLAFFVEGTPDGLPSFEQSLRVYDNGVVGRLTFEFGGLQVVGTLRTLEVLPDENCE